MNNTQQIMIDWLERLSEVYDRYNEDPKPENLSLLMGYIYTAGFTKEYIKKFMSHETEIIHAGGPVRQKDGEWCTACGVWKKYGVADYHHCTGYKVTC